MSTRRSMSALRSRSAEGSVRGTAADSEANAETVAEEDIKLSHGAIDFKKIMKFYFEIGIKTQK